MPLHRGPDGKTFRFPDDATPAEIQQAMQDFYDSEAAQQQQTLDVADTALSIAAGPLGLIGQAARGKLRERAQSGEAARDFAKDEGAIDRGGSLLERGYQSAAGGLSRVIGTVADNEALRRRAREGEQVAATDIAGTTSWDEAKQGGLGGYLKFGAETAIQSLPEMAITAIPYAGIPLEATIQAGRIGQERAQNDGRSDATVGDIAKAAPFGVASAALERVGIKGVGGKFGSSTVGKIVTGAATEAATEAAQSSIEYTGGVAGTQTPFDASQMFDEALAGAVGGGVGGGVITTTVEGGRVVHRVKSRKAGPGVVETASQEASQVTPEDNASPLPNDAIATGRATVAAAEASPVANEVLAQAGLPQVKTPVRITDGETVTTGTIEDAFDGGVKVRMDNGSLFEAYFDDLNELGVRIEQQSPDDILAARAQAAKAESEAALADFAPEAVPVSETTEVIQTPETVGGDAIAGFKAKTRRVESGGNDTAKNPRSSAEGRYQFTDGTFVSVYRQEFGNTGESNAQILAKKFDTGVQERLMDRLTRDNAASLERAGLPVTEGNLYLAHFAGQYGAKNILQADPNAPIESVLGNAAVRANPFLRGKTAGDVARWANDKMGGGGTVQTETVTRREYADPYEQAFMDYQRVEYDQPEQTPLISAQEPDTAPEPVAAPTEPVTQPEAPVAAPVEPIAPVSRETPVTPTLPLQANESPIVTPEAAPIDPPRLETADTGGAPRDAGGAPVEPLPDFVREPLVEAETVTPVIETNRLNAIVRNADDATVQRINAALPDGVELRQRQDGGYSVPKRYEAQVRDAVAAPTEDFTQPRAVPKLNDRSGSWVVVDRQTGEQVFETFERDTAERVNRDRYDVLTAAEYLGQFNQRVREAGGVQPEGNTYTPLPRKQRGGDLNPPAVRNEPRPPVRTAPAIEGTETRDTAVTTTGREIPVEYAVVDLNSLVTSHTTEGTVNPDFPAELQPRDRSRGTSQAQITEIASRLDPRLLGRTVKASDGAPIISPEGIVESGNGRTLAIAEAYRRGGERADAYRSFVEQQGFDTTGIEQPVLVRVRDTALSPQDVQAFTREANQRDTAGFSATEQAVTDAESLSADALSLYRGGDVDAAGNRDFVRRFMETVPTTERANMVAADGSISQDAIRRINAALVQKAYGNAQLVTKLNEASDNNIKAIGGALVDVAGQWSQMTEAARNGVIDPEMDVTEYLNEAVGLVDRARREGKSVADLVNQTDIFSGETVDPRTEAALRLMFHNTTKFIKPVSRTKLVEGLSFFADQAMLTSSGADLLGVETKATPEAVLARAREKFIEGQTAEQGGLFAGPGDAGVLGDVRQDGGNRDGTGESIPQESRVESRDGAAQEVINQADAPIEDFGEKILGARKDMWRDYADRLDRAKTLDVQEQPLSKTWPEPNYQKLVKEGADDYTVAAMRALRDAIPPKPRSYGAVAWGEKVTMLRDMAGKMLADGGIASNFQEKLGGKFARSLSDLQGAIDLYREFGHEKSLKDYKLTSRHYDYYRDKGENVTVWTITRKGRTVADGLTREEVLADFREKLESGDVGKKKRGGPKFEIYSLRSQPGKYHIGIKIGKNYTELETFDSVAEARAYRLSDEGDAALNQALEDLKYVPEVRRAANAPRIGENYRNGSDVTPEQFSETFGFRGVQFGNYVESARRQADLNEAYDALMDLSAVVGVPPAALSLNGELGLAFGARGKGGKKPASAHYESGQVVINLTKRAGAGSLAHEWFHAVDSYFARKGGKPLDFMTERSQTNGDVRPEMVQAFKDLMAAINSTSLKERSSNLDKTRAKPYWATGLEMAARSFESYIINKLDEQSFQNDYLANIATSDEFISDMLDHIVSNDAQKAEEAYPYPTAGEIPAIKDAFDRFFETVETRDADGRVEMYRIAEMVPTSIDPAKLQARLAELQLDDKVNLAVTDLINGNPRIAGSYRNRLIKVAMQANQDAEATLNHEVVHAMKEMGLFRDAEWKALARNADIDSVRNRYQGLDEEALTEEAIADRYMKWVQGRKETGFVQKAFERIRDALRAIGQVFRGEGFTTAESVFRAMDSGKVGAREAGPLSINEQKDMVVYHGSPHDFDTFSLDAIGTGEGAQAYGWGLYFAGRKEIAEFYRDTLSGKSGVISFPNRESIPLDRDEMAQSAIMNYAGLEQSAYSQSVVRQVLHAFRVADQYDTLEDIAFQAGATPYNAADETVYIAAEDIVNQMADDGASIISGRLYTVDIPEDGEFLLWDKPLSEQPEKVREGIQSVVSQTTLPSAPESMRAGDVYEIIARKMVESGVQAGRGDMMTSLALKDAGIAGIKYLDGGSRSDGDGTYNYVLFDDTRAKVLEKYSITDAPPTDTPEFQTWFGDSKVTDASGNPIVVYHGAPDARFVNQDGTFKNINERYGEPSNGRDRAFWFAKDRSVAASYADDTRAFDYQNADPGVIPAYLKLENPLIVDGKGKAWREAQQRGKTSDVIEQARDEGRDGVIIRNVRDRYNDWEGGPQSRPTDTYVVFSSNQIKHATDNAGTFDPANPDIRYSIVDQTQSDAFKRWAGDDAEIVTRDNALSYDFETGKPVAVEAFHGTKRPDRVGSVFRADRATAGPMAFFTSDPELASSYAQGKEDTSISEEETNYANWFKVDLDGEQIPIIDAWDKLPVTRRAEIRRRAPKITIDYETGEDIVFDENATSGNGGYDLQREGKGNPLRALVEAWLNSGSLYDRESDFTKVLELAGFDRKSITMDSPYDSFSSVYPVWVSMKNPLVTNNIPESVSDALRDAANRNPGVSADRYNFMWDKNDVSLKDWVSDFEDAEMQKYAWTRIPDAVTDVFRSLGYDGIIDWSGKMGPDRVENAPVYIPFSESQVKSVFNSGTFDPTNHDIRYSLTDAPFERTADDGPGGVTPRETVSVLNAMRDPSNFDKITGAIDDLRVKLQDRMLPVRRLQEGIADSLEDTMNPYQGEEIMSGRAGARIEQLYEKSIEPLFEGMKRTGVSLDELETYLYARHAQERNAQIAKINPEFAPGEGSGMTDIQARAILSRVEKSGKKAEMDALASLVDTMNREALQTRVESGLLSQEEADAWQAQYENYVPLRGIKELSEVDQRRVDRIRSQSGISAKGKESKRAFGRRSEADNILAYSILQAEEAIVRAEKNRVARQFLKLAQANPDPDLWTINKVETRRRINPTTGLVENYVVNQLTAEDADYTVTAKVDGKEVRVTMNRDNPSAKRIADAMRNLDGPEFGTALHYASRFNQYFSAINTRYNPAFVVTNALRDMQTLAVVSQQYESEMPGITAKVFADYPKAMLAKKDGSGDWSKWRREWELAGGKVYYNQTQDLNQIRRDIERRSKQITSPNQAAKVWGKTFDAIEAMNESVERAIRLSVYKNAREMGRTKDVAASMARNVTVNFTRKGKYGPFLNAFYAFFNASVQGNANLVRAAAKSSRVRKAMAGFVVAGFLSDMLNSMVAGDDDDGENFWEKVPAWEKERNLVLMLPGAENGEAIKIPLAYGLNALVAIGRNASAVMRGKKNAGEAAMDTALTFADAFNPVGGGGTWWNVFAPTALDPIADIAENKNFTGRPIQPEQNPFSPPVTPSSNYFPSVDPIAKKVAKGVNAATGGDDVEPGWGSFSPESLEYIAGYLTGGAGRFVSDVITIGNSAFDPTAELEIRDIPFAKSVVTQKSSSVDKTAYYERTRQVEQVLDRAKQYQERGDMEGLANYVERNRTIGAMEAVTKEAEKEMRKVRKARNETHFLHELGQIDDETYSERLDVVSDLEEQIVQAYNKRWMETVEAE